MYQKRVNNVSQLTKRFHKTSTYSQNGVQKKSHYAIAIPCIPNQNGLGDSLTNIMIEYSNVPMFGKPTTNTPEGHVPDTRPQIVIANHCNHNNTLPFVQEPNSLSECYEGAIFRRNINLQRLTRKHVFLESCKLIQDNLFITLFSSPIQNSTCDQINLFGCLPIELIELIVHEIKAIGLFNSCGVEYITAGDDFCC